MGALIKDQHGLVPKDSEIRSALNSCRAHFLFAMVFNAFGNLLVLAFPLYMISVYNRVIPSHSRETLVALFVGVAIAGLFKAAFDWLRGALFLRAGLRIDRKLSDRVLSALFRRRASGRHDAGNQVLRDLDIFRSFVTGIGGAAVIEMPWAGLFLAALFILNPMMAFAASASIVAIIILTVVQILVNRSSIKNSDRASITSYSFVESNLVAAEAVIGMGLLAGLLRKWETVREPALAAHAARSYRDAGFLAANGYFRILAQSFILAVGVLEIINGDASAGVILGAIFVFRYALNPFDKMIYAWSAYLPVKEGLYRLDKVLEAYPPPAERINLPRPPGQIEVLRLVYVPPGQDKAVLRGLTFTISEGMTVGIIGLVGSGKTTLARLLVGCTQPTGGHVRLGGHEVFGWSLGDGGSHIGYLPQSVAILAGTVAENIGRYGAFPADEVVAAAKLAGAHDIVQRLPLGYDTVIGPGGYALSGGQQQLIALARAIIGKPSFLVLDEPNSNLDGPGEEALMRCIQALKEARTTVVLISHRPMLVGQMQRVMVLKDGEIVEFGTSATVFERLGRPTVVRGGARKPELAASAQPKLIEKT